MILTFSVTMFYFAFGMLFRILNKVNPKYKSQIFRRTSLNFLMCSLFNMCVLPIAILIPVVEDWLLAITGLSVCLFTLFVMAELNKGYREHRDVIDDQMELMEVLAANSKVPNEDLTDYLKEKIKKYEK